MKKGSNFTVVVLILDPIFFFNLGFLGMFEILYKCIKIRMEMMKKRGMLKFSGYV